MKLKFTGLLLVLGGLLISGCKKQQEEFKNPYEGGKPALGIVSDPQQIAVPASGVAGTEVTIKVTGAKKWHDEKKLTFLFNGQQAEIVAVSATEIKIKVPAKASSGVTSFVVDGQLVFGPTFTVIGKVNLDPTYVNTVGANGAVFKAFPVPNSTDLILMGSFDNYDNKGSIKRINRITRVLADGTWDRSFLSGSAANSTVTNMAAIGPYYYIVGDFTGYAQQGSGISKITRLYTSGQIDTVQVITYTNKTRFVPRFNGGVAGGNIRDIYPAENGKMVVVGNFNFYVNRRYDYASYTYKDSTAIDSTDCRQIARLNEFGKLDSTWRFDKNAPGYKNKPGRSFTGANGQIWSIGHNDGKILIYGEFTKFDDVNEGRVVRILPSGLKDPTFNVGTGANNNILFMSYDATQNKYMAIGTFTSFNGKEAKYLVKLNYDGSVDESFKAKEFSGGEPNFVKILSDGLVVVTGSFRAYDGVIRNGLMFLDKTGGLAEGYNTIGNFAGGSQRLVDVYETRSADNKRALLLMGNFSTFDSKPKNNIVRVTLD